ncbi:Predicted dithiol-disulfide isomerase, DsbA family [Meinhardsimonia xiamenensis]|jgi:predicted DsbA family dithiol-disulfide isomerase|uniref:Predicted dithiol-disulfide isomerase, DsbA family n=1 Tax=Meinhardsimonia xiamenensis TaxID=990712 RepID=A0A1G9FM08_9RHOB|nr:DsbA family oxidoreductase [Meinhardsimonia xiamenensis]PRX37777.1 putative DsbA family dithiol-disulfide isomerase [Meinhardsimonia xiamenensis]SDK89409.1 Predicted dithiol-disulfide isomerase, DsbA family [Meinhardsimonia xiamenensis]
MVRLDIFSDPICPWCYIGKAHLDRALEARPDHPFEVVWHPFMLNPDMPPEGMDRREYLEAKFGGPEGAAEVYGRIREAARAAGLDIDFDAIRRTPSTLDAQRLIHWAGIEGRQTPVVAGLFRAYFNEGRDISDHEVLADVADSAGLDAAMILRLLASDADVEEIRARDAWAREHGVRAVPTFVVGGRHAVPGAQPPELWLKVIDEITGREGA